MSTVFNCCKEWIVYRCECKDFSSFWNKHLHIKVNIGYHTTADEHPVFFCVESMSTIPPSLDSIIHTIPWIRIPKNRMITSFFHCLKNLWLRCEVRICNPEWKQSVFLTKIPLYIPLNTTCTSAVNYFVKIIHISLDLPFFLYFQLVMYYNIFSLFNQLFKLYSPLFCIIA